MILEDEALYMWPMLGISLIKVELNLQTGIMLEYTLPFSQIKKGDLFYLIDENNDILEYGSIYKAIGNIFEELGISLVEIEITEYEKKQEQNTTIH